MWRVAATTERLAKLGDRDVPGRPHIDHASGYSGNRGRGLQAAIDEAVRHAPSELWVWHTNRLGRGTSRPGEARAIGKLLYDLREQGVTVRSVEDDEFATNEMLWSFASAQASKYAEDLSAAVRRGQRDAFEQGKWPGARYVPDGYVAGQQRGVLEVDEPRATVIRRMAELAAEGHRYNEVARRLNAEGYRTREGKAWRGTRVRDTLSNPVYAGRVAWRRREPDEEVREGLHEAIIDPELFDALGVKIGLRNRGSTGAGRPAPAAALSGLAFCDACGEKMQSRRYAHVRKKGTRQTIYMCASKRHRTGTCDAPVVDASKVDQAIMARLTAWTTDWEAWKEEQAKALDLERGALAAELASREQDLAQREKERKRMGDRHRAKPSDTTEEALTECRRLVKEAEARVHEVRKRLDAYPTEPDTDALLDVQSHFSGIATDPTLTVNAKAKLLLKAGVSPRTRAGT